MCTGGRRGFTLLEAVVALVVIGFAVVGASGAFGTALRHHAALESHTVAVQLAEARLNDLVLLPDDSLWRYSEPRQGYFPPPFDGFWWQARAEQRRRSASLLNLTVLVRWEGGEYRLATETFRPNRFSAVQGGVR